MLIPSCAVPKGILQLEKLIKKAIDHLPHLHDALPVSFLKIKEELEGFNEDYIEYFRYWTICKKIAPSFTVEDANTLVNLLHDLGIMLNFSADIFIEETKVLNLQMDFGGNLQELSMLRLF